ncbi:DUF6069 family protein [Actinomadura sp. 7K507]|uniref:DUF6069 family protein n=1 Tax=Actinomadura sp. 7K507 TaxID=2530365 RepID=UPI0010439ED0|nr:DUF6069 family protein [Actinomadura sp. 7K507]TDC86056.1 hypothetical protein E1285_24000 [Actinomadura sp. 7K507]
MRTLALRGGERVAVVAAEWRDAFGVVTRGRVQMELRDGEPGPVLGRDAGFWLHGTGVRALRNPGRRTARVRVITPRTTTAACRSTHHYAGHRTMEDGMNSTNDAGAAAGPASGQTSRNRRLRGLAGTGFIATLAAMLATTLVAALAQAVGVDFEVPDGGETIPLSGFAVVTGFFSMVGVVIAVALLRWSTRPAGRFVWTAVSLTAISLVPPFLSGANTGTVLTLLVLHLVTAAVMIPTLARSLRTRTD